MKFSDWLRQNDFFLNTLVTRHLGYWGYQCLICRERKEGEVKDTLLYLVTGPLNESGSIPKYPFRNFLGFGGDKFSALEDLVKKAAGKPLCYMDGDKGHVLVEVPDELSLGEKSDYAGLVKKEDLETW